MKKFNLWCSQWSRSQLVFVWVICVFLSSIAMFAAYRFEQANQAAQRWQEIALTLYLNL
jgi:ACR3 family arsenite efflux pump ArsB